MTGFDLKPKWLLMGLMLSILLGLWWQRGIVLQWGLNRILQQTPLTQTRFSGLHLDLKQAKLEHMQFTLQTANGLLAAQLQGVSLAYDLQPLTLYGLHIDQAKLHFNYQPQNRPEQQESVAVMPALPLPQAVIEQLILEVDTPQGVSQISGRFQLDAEPVKPVMMVLTDAAKAFRVQLNPELSHADLTIVQAVAKPMLTIEIARPRPKNWQLNLQANVDTLWHWLTTSTWMPNPLRAQLTTAAFMQSNPNIADMQFKLTAASTDDLDSLQGRGLLTRNQAYLASADLLV